MTPCGWAAASSARGQIVHLDKHAASRRYLNIDHAGLAYRFRPGDHGAYEPFDSPLAALEQVTVGARRLRHSHRHSVGDAVADRAARTIADSVNPVPHSTSRTLLAPGG
jgi:hypothetical protein